MKLREKLGIREDETPDGAWAEDCHGNAMTWILLRSPRGERTVAVHHEDYTPALHTLHPISALVSKQLMAKVCYALDMEAKEDDV